MSGVPGPVVMLSAVLHCVPYVDSDGTTCVCRARESVRGGISQGQLSLDASRCSEVNGPRLTRSEE
jgi:hypothetical protein